MDSTLRLRKHAKRQGQRPGIPTTVSTTSVDAVPTSDAADDDTTDSSSSSSSSSNRAPSSSNTPDPATRTFASPTREEPTPSTSSTQTPVQEVTPTTSSSSTSTTEDPTTSSTSTSSSSTPLTTTTIISTSTSSRLPATTSTTLSTPITSSTTLAPVASSTTTNSRSLVTSFVTASAVLSNTLSSSAQNTLASGSSGSSDSNGPSTGTVVGIVAGALVGVVVLSGIVGYFFRTKCSNKNDEDYDENPFGNIDNAYGDNQSRGEMRRQSQLLGDDDSIHQMSELGGGHGDGAGSGGAWPAMGAAAAGAGAAAAAGAYGLNRANTTMTNAPPGIQRSDTVNPRPPTMIQRHYANMARNGGGAGGPPAMPSFQPGQIINPGQYYPSTQANQSGPYPSFPLVAPGGYAQQQPQGVGHHNRGYSNDLTGPNDVPARSGTPEYQNPQQYFHQAQDSYSSAQNQSLVNPFESQDNVAGMAAGAQYGQEARSGGMDSQTRAKRTLSIRNGGLDQGEAVRDSIYGGM